MISVYTDHKIALIEGKKIGIKITNSTCRKIFISQQENNWHKNYNDCNMSQNLYFTTDLKANREACRRNCGGSNDSNHIKIDPRKGVASDDFSSY